MSEWKECRLDDIISIKSGLPYKGEYLNKGDNYLLGMGCVSFAETFLPNGARRYSDGGKPQYIGKAGDIVLATRQQSDNMPILGMPAIIPDFFEEGKVIVGSNLYMVDNKSDVDNRFLFWLLRTPQYINHIRYSQTGTTVRMITKKDIENFTFHCPPKNQRNTISSLLWNIQDKIETNRKINARLEELAQALFKSWFIDFEPFGGKMPEDWGTGILADELNLVKNPIKASDVGNLPYLPIDSIPMNHLGIEEYDKSENAQSSLITFSKNDILIGAMRVYFHRVILSPFDGVTRTTCFVLRPHNEIALPYLLLLCNQNSTIEYACSTSKGTTMPYAVWENGLANMEIIIPPIDVLGKFCNTVMPLITKIRDSYKEVKALITLRDTLLPKLMSGEIKTT